MNRQRTELVPPNSICVRAVRHGLTLAIPFLIMGSFALLFNNFPSAAYQDGLSRLLGGSVGVIFSTLYDISLGSLSLILCITISLSYGRLAEANDLNLYPMAALSSYLAFCGGIHNQETYVFSAEWVFTATCITLAACILFSRLSRISRSFYRLHTAGAEYLFNISIQSLFPIVCILLLFAAVGYLLRLLWGDNNITNFGSYLFMRLFSGMSGNLLGIVLYVFITHVLWFFGIHGTNTLEAVSQRLFEHNVDINQSLILAGKVPTEIYSKTFLDTFVFLGGCGCALSLVLALCFCARRSNNRKLAYVALPSVLFNISEIAVFGFPIIFNFTMLVPFLLTPLILTLVSVAAAQLGLVPVVTQSVDWTVPILISGYKATGSVAGSLLQLFNVAVGVCIYMPFVKRSERRQSEEFQQAVRQMERDMAEGETKGLLPAYLHYSYPRSNYAKTLSMDLRNALERGQLQLFYQAQVTADNQLHGAEALLRWKHPVAGYISPPVLIELAYESGFLEDLGYALIHKACQDAQIMERKLGRPLHLSINISPKQLSSEHALEQMEALIHSYKLTRVQPVLEITERAAMDISDRLNSEFELLHRDGIQFSMDDFGMGHNSLLGLQKGFFDEVKIDGKLVEQLLLNERSQDIVAGIIQMSDHLNNRIVAEFVETQEQRDLLDSLGCHIYQGYYFSRPVELEEFLTYARSLDSF